jgi:hypothetical protein
MFEIPNFKKLFDEILMRVGPASLGNNRGQWVLCGIYGSSAIEPGITRDR